MNLIELHKKQKRERKEQTEEILNSPEDKRLIVSGPGTGKTYIFDRILKKNKSGRKLVLTFIRRLITEIDQKVQIEDTCKTFHEFAKGLLHNQKGSFDLQPYLTDIIQKDANLLGLDLGGFDTKFQELDEYGPEIPFYISRGDYYQTVSFNDSVYRIYKMALKNINILPQYSQIIIDEYQDFNKLEAEFIKVLERRGPILIAGDDDQALYDGRSASSEYIKELTRSGKYKVFTPKYCSRCTEVIVNAFNSFLNNVQKSGYFDDRVEKDYECYLPDKGVDSSKCPKIDVVECATIKTVAKYVKSQVYAIDKSDITDSLKAGSEYPTVLIIGPVHYLRIIVDELSKEFTNVQFNPSGQQSYSIANGYRLILKDEYSNLGWRILTEFSLDENTFAEIVAETESGVSFINLLQTELVDSHKEILGLLKKISRKETFDEALLEGLKRISPDSFPELVEAFKYNEEEEKETVECEEEEPTILLTSYKGAKGLSGGHVFLLGAHENLLPKSRDMISDVEISQFIVAMTRARKKLHIVSNRWYINPVLVDPVTKTSQYIEANRKSIFVDWIPSHYLNDLGYLRSNDIESQ